MNTRVDSDFWVQRSTCRCCGGRSLRLVIDLGVIPLADALLDDPEMSEKKVPLTAMLCTDCFLLQIAEDVNPAILFSQTYPYYTSANPALVKHFQSSARSMIEKYQISRQSMVIDIGSNDGTLLAAFKEAGAGVLGIEPTGGPFKHALEKGIPGINDFFSFRLAQKIRSESGKAADLITGNNVLAHVPDPNDFIKGVSHLLADTGHAVFEVPHVLQLIENLEFDTIFHQHYSYFSLNVLKRLVEKHNLFINDVESLQIHGGSIRVTISPQAGQSENVKNMLLAEEKRGLNSYGFYAEFARSVQDLKAQLLSLLSGIVKENKTIEGYGAAGKANTLINFMGIGKNYISSIGDKSVYKQGKFFPGVKIPIISPAQLLQKRPDYILILAWNFADDIIAELADFRRAGGKFIVPIPKLSVI